MYFPYTLTQEYEGKSDLQRVEVSTTNIDTNKMKYLFNNYNQSCSQNQYTQEHDQTKDKNRFDVTHTPVYSHQKDHEEKTSDVIIN